MQSSTTITMKKTNRVLVWLAVAVTFVIVTVNLHHLFSEKNNDLQVTECAKSAQDLNLTVQIGLLPDVQFCIVIN